MKQCSKCLVEKTFDKFSIKGTSFSSYCRECNSAYLKEHYQKNKEYYIKKSRMRTKKLRVRLIELLKTRQCIDCGNTDWRVLDFDHIDPATKVDSVTKILTNTGNWNRVLEEIEKCDTRCSNCHRIRTITQFNHYSYLEG